MDTLTIFTDGGCSGNPGPGGWAFVALLEGSNFEGSGGEKHTTNNKMELTAVIEALKWFKSNKSDTNLTIYTDSQYVQKGISEWIHNWKKNGWKTAAKESVKNKELWEELDILNASVKPSWKWVKGHAGHEHNERCDDLVQVQIAIFKK